MENLQVSLKGQMLLAMPHLMDPNFAKTVSCICEHTAEGAMGIIVNKVLPGISEKDIFDELDLKCTPNAPQNPVYIGGPVQTNQIFILHGPPFNWEGCLQISATLALSNTRDIIEAIALEKGPRLYQFTLGGAGWGAGQLENEIKMNAWLTSPILEKIVFDLPVDHRWEEAVKAIGINPAVLSTTSGNA